MYFLTSGSQSTQPGVPLFASAVCELYGCTIFYIFMHDAFNHVMHMIFSQPRGYGHWSLGFWGAPHIFMHTIPSAWIMFCILSAWVCASFACFAFRSLALSGAFLQPLMPSAVAFHLCLGDPTRQRVFWILAPFFHTFRWCGPTQKLWIRACNFTKKRQRAALHTHANSWVWQDRSCESEFCLRHFNFYRTYILSVNQRLKV